MNWFNILKTTLTPLGQAQLAGLKREAVRMKGEYTKTFEIDDLGEMISTLQFYADNRPPDRMWLMPIIDYLQQLKWNGEINMSRPLKNNKDVIEEVVDELDSIWSRHIEGSS